MLSSVRQLILLALVIVSAVSLSAQRYYPSRDHHVFHRVDSRPPAPKPHAAKPKAPPQAQPLPRPATPQLR
jgi:hypothetical protein